MLHKRINHTWDFVVMQAREQLRCVQVLPLHTHTHTYHTYCVIYVQSIQTEAEGRPYCPRMSGAGLLAHQQTSGMFTVSALLHSTVLYFILLYFTVLYCIILFSALFYCTVQYNSGILHCSILHCPIPTLHHTSPQHTTTLKYLFV